MGNSAIVKLIEHDQNEMSHFSIKEVSTLFGHSFFLGVILTFMTYVMLAKMSGHLKKKKRLKLILGASNILFICVGITALMILVNNNLARAFAIGAALSLVRFRVKMGQKSLSSNFLFGIIAGIACGLKMLNVAWMVTAAYVVIQCILMALIHYLKDSEAPNLDDLKEGED